MSRAPRGLTLRDGTLAAASPRTPWLGGNRLRDYTADNFLQWFIKEQLEEVASMRQLLRVVQRAGEGNLLRVEEFLAREKDRRFALSKEE
jgi:hypothetical protein